MCGVLARAAAVACGAAAVVGVDARGMSTLCREFRGAERLAAPQPMNKAGKLCSGSLVVQDVHTDHGWSSVSRRVAAGESNVSYLTKRFEQFDNQARVLLARALQLVSVGLTLLVTAAAAFVAYERYEILLAIPVSVILLWAVGIRMIHEHQYLAAYRDAAEQALADMRIGDPSSKLAVWHSFGGRRLATGPSNTALYGVLIVISLGLMIGPLVVAVIALPSLLVLIILEAFGVIVALVALGVAARGVNIDVAEAYALIADESESKRSQGAACRLFSKGRQPTIRQRPRGSSKLSRKLSI